MYSEEPFVCVALMEQLLAWNEPNYLAVSSFIVRLCGFRERGLSGGEKNLFVGKIRRSYF